MRRTTILVLSILLSAHRSQGQLVQGQVVAQDSRRPVLGARVALLDDGKRIVVDTRSDSAGGYFFIDAPRPGRYQLAAFDRLGNPYAGSLFLADSGATIERQLVLPELPASFDGVPVTAAHLHVRGMPVPQYPDAARDAKRSGTVRVAFIVDAAGAVDAGSIHIVSSTDSAFTESVRRVLQQLRFVPATEMPRPPRVIDQVTFAFTPTDELTLPCDVCVSPRGITRTLP